MKQHPTSIDGFDTLEAAAIAVGKMRYDAIAVFLRYLREDLAVQQDKDAIAGKKHLVADTDLVLEALSEAEYQMEALFQKYKHHMAEELEITPEIEYK